MERADESAQQIRGRFDIKDDNVKHCFGERCNAIGRFSPVCLLNQLLVKERVEDRLAWMKGSWIID
jgi:hypothetical protein